LLERLDMHDRALLQRWVASDARGWVRTFWRTITHAGGPVVTIAAVMGAMLAGRGDVRTAGMQAALTLATTHLAAQILKRFFSRARPRGLTFEALIAMPPCFSFPSGHAIAASSVAFVFAVSFPALAPGLLALSAIVAVSRVRLGVHYPGDVIAGQVVALAGTILVMALW
jgi:undecaprenyl-diphosphatase